MKSGKILGNDQNLSSLFNRISIPYKNELYRFISNTFSSENPNTGRIRIFNTVSLTNIAILKEQSTPVLINFHKLNDMRRLNVYFLNCYEKVSSGGTLIGCFEPLENIRTRLRSKMPRFLFTFLYPLHFIFYRILPKLPVTKRIYFILTKGQKRIFSKAEIFGRLSFCGFEMLNNETFGNKTYFICKKVKTVSTEKNPSYGPVVRLKRIGLNKEIISIYKLRTMYPYSEFIQKDLYDKFQLENSGKLKNDYRLTNWGRIFRRFFIDEIPQIYNWIRGDLKLIGVRALSEHYFNLYPKDLQELRVRSKPGLIPPFYVDLPRSFDELIESEKKYLLRYRAKPITTNFTYLFRAVFNIVFKGARSK
jgi:lipopolysaccharide/colanic/teichoic acid biosynthesis glycosyltransferase